MALPASLATESDKRLVKAPILDTCQAGYIVMWHFWPIIC